MEQKSKKKTCTKCLTEKTTGDFYRNKRYADNLHSWCKDCVKDNARTWAKENKERHYEINRNWRARQKKESE